MMPLLMACAGLQQALVVVHLVIAILSGVVQGVL